MCTLVTVGILRLLAHYQRSLHSTIEFGLNRSYNCKKSLVLKVTASLLVIFSILSCMFLISILKYIFNFHNVYFEATVHIIITHTPIPLTNFSLIYRPLTRKFNHDLKSIKLINQSNNSTTLKILWMLIVYFEFKLKTTHFNRRTHDIIYTVFSSFHKTYQEVLLWSPAF